MREPEVALVFSPETWVEQLHRHFTDHGGARVRQVVMDPGLALEEEYGTLIVSHRWPALTRGFVQEVHRRRRRVLGVYDRAEPAGRAFLVSLGVDLVIESEASMPEFLDALVSLAPEDGSVGASELEALVGGPVVSADQPGAAALTVVAGASGGGATEVAIEMARAVGRGSVLVDADEVAPAIAQRLGLDIEPNLRTAVDAVEYGMGSLDAALVSAPSGAFGVVCGLPNVSAWPQVRPGEVTDLLRRLAIARDHVVTNVSSRLEDVVVGAGRGRYGIGRAAVAAADALVGVGPATPVGVTRLLGWVAEVRALNPTAAVHLVVNRAPVDAFRRAEIESELRRSYQPAGLWLVPADRRVDTAAWKGELVARGPFTAAVARVARALAPQTAPNRARTSTLRRLGVGRARARTGAR